MSKRYLKKLSGSTDLVVVKNPPIWGKRPDLYRDRNWNIDGIWYSSKGVDLLDSLDPFGDSSLIHKWRLNGNLIDLITSVEATTIGDLLFEDGAFNSKCYGTLNAGIGTNYINCGTVAKSGLTEMTISGFVKQTNTNVLTDWSTTWRLTADDLNHGVNSRIPIFSTNSDGRISSGEHIDVSGEVSSTTDVGKLNNQEKWMHVVQVINNNTVRTYIQGKLVDILSTTENIIFVDGTFFIHDKHYLAGSQIQQVEIYNRALKDGEILELTNQQRLVVERHDGLEISTGVFNPPSFTYLEEANMLVELEVSPNGDTVNKTLVRKDGFNYENDNIVRMIENELVDRYGNSVLSGSVLQVVSVTQDNPISYGVTARTWYDLDGLEADIIPRKANSKIIAVMSLGAVDNDLNAMVFRVERNNVPVGVGIANGVRQQIGSRFSGTGTTADHTYGVSQTLVDEPKSNGKLNYKVRFMVEGTTVYFNRNVTYADTTNEYNGTSQCTLLLMEIGGNDDK